jgi:hypothetical protein
LPDLPCPKGFIAQTGSGPHLVTGAATSPGSGARTNSSGENTPQTAAPKNGLARRCVPEKSKKTATNATSGKASKPQ